MVCNCNSGVLGGIREQFTFLKSWLRDKRSVVELEKNTSFKTLDLTLLYMKFNGRLRPGQPYSNQFVWRRNKMYYWPKSRDQDGWILAKVFTLRFYGPTLRSYKKCRKRTRPTSCHFDVMLGQLSIIYYMAKSQVRKVKWILCFDWIPSRQGRVVLFAYLLGISRFICARKYLSVSFLAV